MNPNCLFRHLNGTYADKLQQSALGLHVRQNRIAHESFARHVVGALPLAVCDGRNSPCVGVLCPRNHVPVGNSKGNADLAERSRSSCYYPTRRTFASAIHRSWHSALVDIDLMGPRNRGRIDSSRRRAGLSYWLRARSGLCCLRETSALVNYTHRFPGRSGGRIILPRLRHRTFADGWFRTLLVDHNSAGYFFAWPLVGRRGQYFHRARGRRNLDRILFVASRSSGQYDRPRHGGFCCQRGAKILFLTATDYKDCRASVAAGACDNI